jgi:hypothetical protein
MRLRTAVLAGALAVGGGIFAFAAPANAAPATQCTGDLGAVTVSGNLSVPADQTCTLTGTTVTGTATVGKNANLLVITGTIKGNVTVGEGGYFDATATSTLGRNLYLVDASGTRFDTTKIGGSVRSSDNDKGFAGFIFADSSEITGNVDQFATGELLLERSTVKGSVRGIDNHYTQLYRTSVGRDVTAIGNAESAVVCESAVAGDGLFYGNEGTIQLGAGPIFGCAGQNEWDDLSVSNNDAAITVTNNVVHGDLCGYRNTPAPTGGSNTVEGRTSGQFVNLRPTPAV